VTIGPLQPLDDPVMALMALRCFLHGLCLPFVHDRIFILSPW
jgi:hypothetical protein